ncbi:ATP synthase subunit I [Aquella oligotrophica]|uniref:ATP synthase subunit I n=1 Tax=Aquella oligotrophica TaxID=2067065 RepID=UPI0013158F19|nr:ATP synthase subunit I [Aquella oligotrophica]
MTYNSAKIALKDYLRVIKLQFAIGLTAVIVVTLCGKSILSFLSALCGFLMAVIPAVIYIKIAWSDKILNAEQIFAKHKKAEMFKFMLTIFGFLAIFIFFRKIQAGILFVTYVATLSSYWVCLFYQVKTKN